MFQDACHDPVRQFEGAPPGSAIHQRSAARSNGIKEGSQFRAERFLPLGLEAS